MRSYVPDFELKTPASLTEALELLARDTHEWQPFAGGTDLMVLFEAGKLEHKKYVNIWPFDELRGINVDVAHVDIGALSTYSCIQRHELLQTEFPMLCQAASETGGLAIQNRGTLGGNIVNASPAADSPPALLAYGAQLELMSNRGTRWIPYDEFHTGYKKMKMGAGELVTRVRLPRVTAERLHFYRKVGTRRAQAISKICLAATGSLENGRVSQVRIAVGSVAPTVIRCRQTEDYLHGKTLVEITMIAARDKVLAEVSPIDDIRSTATYRRRVVGNVLFLFLKTLKATR